MIEVSPVKWHLLTGAEDFPETRTCHWDQECHAYMLKQAHKLVWPAQQSVQDCQTALKNSPTVIMDYYQQLGSISEDGKTLLYNAGHGFKPLRDQDYNSVTISDGKFTNLSIGSNGLLAAPFSNKINNNHGVVVFHLVHRWQTVLKTNEAIIDGTFDSLNNLWLVSQSSLYLCQGSPLHHPFSRNTSETEFMPLQENPDPLHIVWIQALPADIKVTSIQHYQHSLYILADIKNSDNTIEQLVIQRASDEHKQAPIRINHLSVQNCVDCQPYAEQKLPYITDFFVQADNRLLLMTLIKPQTDQNGTDTWALNSYTDSLCIKLYRDNRYTLIQTSYPLLEPRSPRFIHRPDRRIFYLSSNGPRELSARKQARYFRSCRVTIEKQIDSGSMATVWHRIYLDARIPAGTRIILFAGTYNEPGEAIHYHRQQELLWNPLESELAFTRNPAGHVQDEAGLFEVLLQTTMGNIRQLKGRYLSLRIALFSDGHQSPQIHNIRIYYPRFCYQQAYLPAYFQQQEKLDTSTSYANGADVRERMLASFEAMLTPIEASVANMDIMYHSQGSPVEFLPALTQMLGTHLPQYWPEARQRRYIQNLGRLQQWNGTLRGLQLILDIISDGAVTSGQIVIVENFRLRRTMASLLGLQLDSKDTRDQHPLTLGSEQSGNSIIGDNLILSDTKAREFLALLDPELASLDDKQAVERFFDQYSHQTSILLHGNSRKLKNQVFNTLSQYMPAHVQWAIYQSDYPFILGLSPLLEINSFIESHPSPESVRLNDTYLGYEGYIFNKAALSPEDLNGI